MCTRGVVIQVAQLVIIRVPQLQLRGDLETTAAFSAIL